MGAGTHERLHTKMGACWQNSSQAREVGPFWLECRNCAELYFGVRAQAGDRSARRRLHMSKTSELLAQNEHLAATVFAPRADEVDRERRFPRENMQELGRAGLLGLLVPPHYAGTGGSLADMAQALEQLASACPSTAMVTL